MDVLYMYTSLRVKDNEVIPINYLSKVEIDGMKIVPDGMKSEKRICIFDQEIKTIKPVECKITNVKEKGRNSKKETANNSTIKLLLSPNHPFSGKKSVMKNYIGVTI